MRRYVLAVAFALAACTGTPASPLAADIGVADPGQDATTASDLPDGGLLLLDAGAPVPDAGVVPAEDDPANFLMFFSGGGF